MHSSRAETSFFILSPLHQRLLGKNWRFIRVCCFYLVFFLQCFGLVFIVEIMKLEQVMIEGCICWLSFLSCNRDVQWENVADAKNEANKSVRSLCRIRNSASQMALV